MLFRSVYLSARAAEIIEHLKAEAGDRSVVFESPMKPRAPLSNMAMLTVLRRMGLDQQTTVHGLCRATFSTWANDAHVYSSDVIEVCLAHRESDIVKAAYRRAPEEGAKFEQQRAALMVAWAEFCGSGEPH